MADSLSSRLRAAEKKIRDERWAEGQRQRTRESASRRPPGPRVIWRLPEQMARAGIRKGSELHRRLVEVMGDQAPSDRHVRQLIDPGPERLSLHVLAGLCEALDCTPGDLLTPPPGAFDFDPAGAAEHGVAWDPLASSFHALSAPDSRLRQAVADINADCQRQNASHDPAMQDGRRRSAEPVSTWHTPADLGGASRNADD